MTTYFILNGTPKTYIENNDDSQLYAPRINSLNYFLPRTNIHDYIANGLYENPLIEWVKQFCRTDKNVLDIGAHTGTYAISLADYCQQVYAFEPQRMTYYALCGGVALSNRTNITCLNIALGSPNQIGSGQLKIVSPDGGGSTLLAPSTSVLRQETVTIQTLDQQNLNSIGFIKIDVEGNELAVIEGGLETLKRSNYPPIIFELNDIDQPNPIKLLEQIGYHVQTINNYNNMRLATH